MFTALLRELNKKGKITDGSIEFYSENGELKVSVDRTVHVIRDNNMLVTLEIKNHKISRAVDAAFNGYF